MAFTAAELQNIANAVLDFHIKGKVVSQAVQSRPLHDDLQKTKKTFPGGKQYITGRVKGTYTSALTGYSHDDEQGYGNPANIKQWQANWYEVGGGIAVTHTELKKAGISVVDTPGSNQTKTHSDSEVIALTNLLEDKYDDLDEGCHRSFAEMLWRDGTQDAKAIPGIQSFILGSPSTGTTFGIDRAANSWWRNRASLAIDASTASNQNLVNTLQLEMRQLRRYATPKHRIYAGATFMDYFEKELRNKGNYTLEGWANQKMIDASVADIAFKGIPIQYEPLLDDLSLQKYAYVLDLNAIRLMPMEGEDWVIHSPARPPEKYVLYRAITFTGGLVADRLNTSGVYSVA